MKKKLMSVLVALCMVLAMLPMAAFATGDVIMKIQFVCDDEVVSAGDYFVPAGVQNYSVLEKYVPEGYELAVSGDFYAEADKSMEVRVDEIITTVTIGVNYWDVVNNKQAAEGEVVVDAGADNVNMTELTDIPKGYELTGYIGDYKINDGWIYVEVKPVDTKVIGVNYWDAVNNVQVAEGEVTVAAGANNVNVSELTDIPAGYEITGYTGDYQINDGWIYVEVKPVDTKVIGVNYWDAVNNVQVAEGEVTVAAGANNVNVSQLTDIPAGYEITGYTGDYQINDGWIYVEVKPATTKTIGVNYWDVESNRQAAEGEVVVAIDANNVNMTELTDIPKGYELTGYVGDYQINDGWIYVEVKPVEGTKVIGVNYWDVETNRQAAEGEVVVDEDANNVHMSELTDIPKGYELTGYIGDYQINDGWIYVEVKPVEGTKVIGVNYWDVVNNKQAAEGEVVVDEDANNVNMSELNDIPEGYKLTGYIGDYQINDGWIYVEVEPDDDKSSEPSMDKTSNGEDAIGEVEPGQSVYFELNSNLPQSMIYDVTDNGDGTYSVADKENHWMVFHDVMSDNLTFKAESLAVTIAGAELDAEWYDVSENTADGCTFEVTIDLAALIEAGVITPDDLSDAAAVVVTYRAQVSEDALDGDEVENSAWVNDSNVDITEGEVTDDDTPITGGMGTAMFTVGGVTLLAAAGVLFVVNRRRNGN